MIKQSVFLVSLLFTAALAFAIDVVNDNGLLRSTPETTRFGFPQSAFFPDDFTPTVQQKGNQLEVVFTHNNADTFNVSYSDGTVVTAIKGVISPYLTPVLTVDGDYTVTVEAVNASGGAVALPITLAFSQVEDHSVVEWTFNDQSWSHPLSPDYAPSTETSVPFWVGQFATAANHSYASSGQFGLSSTHTLPPTQFIEYTDVTSSWPDKGATDFAQQQFTDVVFMMENFVQGSRTTASVEEIAGAQRLIDFVQAQSPGVTYWIYLNWPKMSSADFTLGAAYLPSYWDRIQGTWLAYFRDYQNQLIAANPGVDIRMMPVAPILADIMENNAEAASVPFADYFENNAPHGSSNLYFLAAMIVHQIYYQTVFPDSYSAPVSIHPLIANQLTDIAAYINERLGAYNDNGVRVWP
ncbi:MAG: hypothetical protein KTR20_12895 [Cellvibrionaceae bacterium]|nr:hypothetical protein [Cellvibrionaceae bacterium]